MIATIARTLVRTLPLARFSGLAILISAGLAIMMPTQASAVSANVRNACVGDYFNFCAGMEVGSKELRRCFNKNGAKLSSGCVSALVAAGEVSQAEVNRRAGKSNVAKASTRTKTARIASRGQCVSGPARPGARSISSCRGGATAARGSRGKRQVATLR